MNQRKQIISDFIKSMEGKELDAATCLMGGATGNTAGIMSTRNGGDCSNDNRESCHKSKNDGACKNVSGCCNNSINGTGCNNALKPISPNAGC